MKDMMMNSTQFPATLEDASKSIERICMALSEGNIESAAQIAQKEIPFEPIEQQKRKYTDVDVVRIARRDGFVD